MRRLPFPERPPRPLPKKPRRTKAAAGGLKFPEHRNARFPAGGQKTDAGKAPGYFVTAFNRVDGRMLWEVKLPGLEEPLDGWCFRGS